MFENINGEVRKGGPGHSVAALGGRDPSRAGLPGILAGLGGQGGQSAAPKAGRKRATRRAICYAHCVLEGGRAKSDRKRNIF